MTKEEQAKALLDKYAVGKTSDAGTKQVESWYASYENNGLHIADHKKAEIGKKVFMNLKAILDRHPEPGTARLPVWAGLAKLAAVLLVITGIVIATWTISEKNTNAGRMAAISTTATERKTIRLADGSEIRLDPSTRLVYPVKFKADSRQVVLEEGEAFFKIARDEQRPFTVETAEGLYTKVLGTSFNIRSYKSDKKICITVLTGKVAVGNAEQVFATLIRGQQLSYDKQNRRAVAGYTPLAVYTSIEFEGETLINVCRKLEYVYRVHINLTGTGLDNLRCTATFNTRQTPGEILELLCSLHQLKLSTSGNHKTFNLYKK